MNRISLAMTRSQNENDELRAETDQLRHQVDTLYNSNMQHGLIRATLCDMVLGEGAEDRSDGALMRAVRELVQDRDAIDWLENHPADLTECEGTWWCGTREQFLRGLEKRHGDPRAAIKAAMEFRP